MNRRWSSLLALGLASLLVGPEAHAHGPIDCGQVGSAFLGAFLLYALFPVAVIMLLVRTRMSALIFGFGLILFGGQDLSAWWDDPGQPPLSSETLIAAVGLVASLLVYWLRSRAEEAQDSSVVAAPPVRDEPGEPQAWPGRGERAPRPAGGDRWNDDDPGPAGC